MIDDKAEMMATEQIRKGMTVLQIKAHNCGHYSFVKAAAEHPQDPRIAIVIRKCLVCEKTWAQFM